jgi:hypothetical protein
MPVGYALTPGISVLYSGDAGSLSSVDINDNAVTYEVIRFFSPVDQTSGNLTIYKYCVGAVTGSPTDMGVIVYDHSTTQDSRRGTTTIGSATGADWSAANDSWESIAMTGVTLTKGTPYMLGVYNNIGATASSNYPTVRYRGALDVNLSSNAYTWFGRGTIGSSWPSGSNVTFASHNSPSVLEFDDGSVIGNPWVKTNSPATGTQWRGVRITPDTDITVYGFSFPASTSSFINGTAAIYQGSTLIDSITIVRPRHTQGAHMLGSNQLTAGTAYDLIIKPFSSTTTGALMTLGEASPPSAITNCVPTELTGSVYGDTPGSLTLDSNAFWHSGYIIYGERSDAAGVGGTTGDGTGTSLGMTKI